MQVIVFASQKGGSGKTTLAGHLAVEAIRQMAGRPDAGPVALIDTDPQGSLAKWWNVRKDPEPAFIQSVFSNLFHDLERARNEGYRFVFIDTPPAVTRAISEVVSHADLVIAPTRPSPHDLRAVAPTMEIVDARAKPLIFAVNGANPRARITSEAAIALSQHGTVAPTVIHSRVDFAASMIDGRTVMEVDPVCRSAQEIGALWSYIDGRLQQLEGFRQAIGDENSAGQPSLLGGASGRVFGRRAFH
ncbi:MAG: ParA family protein [Pseudomonadota bacterium]